MLVALGALGGVASAMLVTRTAGSKARFTFTVTPTRQSAARGGAASFSVSLTRAAGFTGPTSFRLTGLPRGVTAQWQLADGTLSAVVPPAETGAVLTLRTSARTPVGTRRVKVLATGGGMTRGRWLTLGIERSRSLPLALSVTPPRQTVPRGASATYKIRIVGPARARKRVRLRVVSLPPDAGATVSRTALTVATGAAQPLGSARLVVEGTGRVGKKTVRRYGVVVLTVVAPRPFHIGGDLTTPLYPGADAPLDLVLANPYSFDIRVVALSVRVRARTITPGCSAASNYAVRQYSGSYPLVVRPGSTRLRTLVASSALWPHVVMRNLPTSQDACKGAALALDYSGLATP
jgi:hypothetical protein